MSSVPNTSENAALLDGLADLRLGQVALRRIFLLLTRLHYSTPDNYGDHKAALQELVWSQDDLKRKLHIDYDYHYTPTKLEQRPAIFVGTDDVAFKRVILDNFRNVTEDNSGTSSSYVASTTVIARHISGTPDEAMALGELSADFYLGIRQMIKERMRVHSFDISGIRSAKPFSRQPEQPDQMFACDLIMPISWIWDWTTTRESHRIKTIGFKEAVESCALPGKPRLQQ